MKATSRRVLKASVRFGSLLIALGVMAPAAQAVDEFATPRPSVQVRPSVGARVSEVYVLRAPDVVGQPVGSARAMLERGRLRVGRETAQLTSERPAGTVIAQDPKPGTAVQPGAPVNLWVATPPQREVIVPPVAVPDLTGETPREAARLLDRYQLGLGQAREREFKAPAGTIIRQSPAPGTRVPRGTRVNVLVATTPTPVPPPVSSTPPTPPVVIEPLAPPAPPIATAPQLPPAPPVVTAPTLPAAPPAVVAAPSTPAPIRKPAPKPVPPPAPEVVSAPLPPVPSVVTPAPQPEAPPVHESGKARWPRPVAWALGSMALLGAGGGAFYRLRTSWGTQPLATQPAVTFAAHWDVGTHQIEATAPLSSGVGLRLVSGVETATTTLETDHLVGHAHDMGGSR